MALSCVLTVVSSIADLEKKVGLSCPVLTNTRYMGVFNWSRIQYILHCCIHLTPSIWTSHKHIQSISSNDVPSHLIILWPRQYQLKWLQNMYVKLHPSFYLTSVTGKHKVCISYGLIKDLCVLHDQNPRHTQTRTNMSNSVIGWQWVDYWNVFFFFFSAHQKWVLDCNWGYIIGGAVW